MKVKISKDLEDLMPSFLKNRKKDILYLRDYNFQKRYEESKKIVHALKGVLGSYGFKEAYELCVSLEKDLKEGRYNDLQEKSDLLSKKINGVVIEYTDEEF